MRYNTTLSIFSGISILASLALGINVVGRQDALANINLYGFRSIYSDNFPDRFIRHRDFLGYIESSTDELGREDATFKLVEGLADPNCTSFEALNFPGHYLRHQSFRVKLHKLDGSQLFREDATFCQKPGLVGNGISYASFNFPDRYLRHKNFELWVDPSDNSDLFNKDATFYPVDPLDTDPSTGLFAQPPNQNNIPPLPLPNSATNGASTWTIDGRGGVSGSITYTVGSGSGSKKYSSGVVVEFLDGSTYYANATKTVGRPFSGTRKGTHTVNAPSIPSNQVSQIRRIFVNYQVDRGLDTIREWKDLVVDTLVEADEDYQRLKELGLVKDAAAAAGS